MQFAGCWFYRLARAQTTKDNWKQEDINLNRLEKWRLLNCRSFPFFKTGIYSLIKLYSRRRARLSHNELPVCKGNLLDQREYHYEGEELGSFDSSRLMSKNGPCRLSKYTVERAVTCFDTIRENRPKKQLLHLVFIGDSRIRQQFFNFLRVSDWLLMLFWIWQNLKRPEKLSRPNSWGTW